MSLAIASGSRRGRLASLAALIAAALLMPAPAVAHPPDLGPSAHRAYPGGGATSGVRRVPSSHPTQLDFLVAEPTPAASGRNVEYVTGSNGFTGGHVMIEGERLYVGAYGLGMRFFDISDPDSPRQVGGYTPGDRADAVPDAAVFDGRTIAVLNGTRRVSSPFPSDVRTDRSEFLDVSDPANPRLLWTLFGQDDGEAHNGDIDDARRLWFPSGGSGAVTASAQTPGFTHRGLRIFDLSPVLQDPPQAPRRIVGVNPYELWLNSPYRNGRDPGPLFGHTHDITLYSDHPVRQPDGTTAPRDILLLAEGDSYDDSGTATGGRYGGSIFVIDVTDPASPVALYRWLHAHTAPGHHPIRYHHEAQLLDGDRSVMLVTDEDMHNGCGSAGGVVAVRLTPDLTDGTELSEWFTPLGTPAPVCSAHVFSTAGSLVFMGAYNAGLQVIDYSVPTRPRQAGYFIAEGATSWGAQVHGDLVYVGDMSRGLDVLRWTPPDPAIDAAGIALSKAKPVAGDRVTITATVRNVGTGAARDVPVRFTDGGTTIGERTISSIPAGGSATASVEWDTSGLKGERTLGVTVDPADAQYEASETNNSASRTVSVRKNKVRNGSFEESANGRSPDGWTAAGDAAWVSGGSDGERSVTAALGSGWTSEAIPVEAGGSYAFDVDVAGASGTLVVEQLSTTGVLLSSLQQLAAPAGGGFSVVTGSLTVADGVTAVRIRLSRGLLGTSTFDDVRLWEE